MKQQFQHRKGTVNLYRNGAFLYSYGLHPLIFTFKSREHYKNTRLSEENMRYFAPKIALPALFFTFKSERKL